MVGKVALVTGGSRGLGLAVAGELLERGCRAAIVARDAGELQRAAEALRRRARTPESIWTLAADLTEPAAAEEAVNAVRSHWGEVDVLVHDAGVIHVGPWDSMGEPAFQAAMDLHFWAALRLARAVLPEMIARHNGRIVNISSIGGLVAVPHLLPYTASKFALVGFSQGLASEVRRHGVRVTCICPFLMRIGSQEHAEMFGRYDREYAWFTALGSVPGFSQSPRRVARAIARACERGAPQLTLALPGKLAALAHGLAPATVTAAMGVAARLLPSSPAGRGARRRGANSYNRLTAGMLRPVVRAAGCRLNEV
jgi:NAD(P)-dependent dehydrogenase (short-subunit alcohol dehydrogenase family)